jgi:antitoxin FitA
MPSLIVRNVSVEVVRALKQRAAAHGRSAEAEHRELLQQALQAGRQVSFKEYLLAMPEVGTEADFKVKRPKARRVQL